MKKLILFLLIAAPLGIFAQSTVSPPDTISIQNGPKSSGDDGFGPPTLEKAPEGEVFTLVDRMPEFPGGQAALMQFLVSNINYPVDAREMGIQGKVYLSFIVDTKGQVTNVKILRGVFPSMDKEAVRVVKMMPLWKPGTQNGTPVNVQFNLPINFQLQ